MEELLPILLTACVIGVVAISIILGGWVLIQRATRGGINAQDMQWLSGVMCEYCGQRVPPGATACTHCGGRLGETPAIGGLPMATGGDITEEISQESIPGGTRVRRTIRVVRKTDDE